MRLLPPNTEHGWTPYVWLIYAGPYVVFPFLFRTPVIGPPASTWTVWALGLVAFLVLYFRGYAVDGAERRPVIIGLAALATALGWLNPGALMFFVYAAAFVGGAVRTPAAGIWIGALTVLGVSASALSGWPPIIIPGVALMAPIIGFVNVHYVETRRRDAALKLAQDEIARLATLAERERIAGDLHDLLGHTLSVIVLKSELASKLLSRDPERAAAEIAEVEQVARTALAEVRRAIHGFRAASLADEFVRARAVLQTAGVQSEIGAPPVAALDPHVEHAMAMIVREAVTNVVRHAKATRCRISVHARGPDVVLHIEDDGIGGHVTEGAGIESMRARAREIGGTLEHRSSHGVAVTLRVPRSTA